MKWIRTVSLLGQFSFTLVFPPVALAWLAQRLQMRFGLGVWVTAAALVMGLMTSASGCVRAYRRLMAHMKKEDAGDKPMRFDRHA